MKFYYRYKLILKNIAPLASSIKEKLLLKLVNEYKWKLSCIYLLIKVEVLLHRSIFPLKNGARLITDRFAFLHESLRGYDFVSATFLLKLYRLDRYVSEFDKWSARNTAIFCFKKNSTIINSS